MVNGTVGSSVQHSSHTAGALLERLTLQTSCSKMQFEISLWILCQQCSDLCKIVWDHIFNVHCGNVLLFSIWSIFCCLSESAVIWEFVFMLQSVLFQLDFSCISSLTVEWLWRIDVLEMMHEACCCVGSSCIATAAHVVTWVEAPQITWPVYVWTLFFFQVLAFGYWKT